MCDTSLGDVAATDRSESRLDFRRVNELGDIWLCDGWGWEKEVLLERRWVDGRSVDLVEGLESTGSPDNESSEMSTWCELKKVKGVDGGSLNTGNVSECLVDLLSIRVWVVDYKRSTSLTVTTTSELTLTRAELSRLFDLVNIWTSTDSLKESDGGGCLCDVECGGGNNEWDFWDGGNTVTTGHEESCVG